MNENSLAKLYQKILAVQQSLEPLEKTGRNDFHRYNYTTAGDVLLPVQRACNEHGLIVIADCIEYKVDLLRASATVVIKLTVADSETGESLSITAPGYAEDWSHKDNRAIGDKAIYKALTGATKYAVRSFFCLPSEDDPERTFNKHTAKDIEPRVRSAPATNNSKLTSTSQSNASLIDQTTIELKRLGWSNDEGRAYLQQNFGKSTRQSLTLQELQQFLKELRSMQPSPVLPAQ